MVYLAAITWESKSGGIEDNSESNGFGELFESGIVFDIRCWELLHWQLQHILLVQLEKKISDI